MASYAGSDQSRVGQIMDSEMLRSLQEGEKSKKAYDLVREHLAQGGALSKGLTKKFQAKGDRNEFLPKYEATFGPRDGKLDASIAGMFGTEIPEGSVYLGSAAVTDPGSSSRSVNGGITSTPSKTTYAPSFMARGLYKAIGAGGRDSALAPAPERAPYEDDPTLTAKREAYERSKQFMDKSDAAGSAAFNANLPGGDTLNSTYGEGERHAKRFDGFLDQLTASAQLQAAEIGNATRKAIYELDPNLQVAQFEDPFRDTGYGKKGNKTLFSFLQDQIA